VTEKRNEKAKAYQRIKQALSLFQLLLTAGLLAAMIAFPISSQFAHWAQSVSSNDTISLVVYFLLFSLFMLCFDFPFTFYSGYILEHRYGLSNQTRGAWLGDFIKKSLLSFFFMGTLLVGLYTLIWKFPTQWWLLAWAGYALISYAIGKIFPVFIVPLFYKYGPVEDESLKSRIYRLAERYGLPVKQIYSINLSKTTKKANAAFMGIGKTKRVVLSDTLLSNFSGNEIEAVVAHELGHFKHGDIWKNLAFGLVSSFLVFGCAAQGLEPLARKFGYSGVGDVAALPVLLIIFFAASLFLMPIQNAFSRSMERAADRFSLKAYPQPEVFIACMTKLAEVNLADPNPNPVYEWFFYNHPAISKRIKMAREVMTS